ncbi:MAG: hypothetical protein OEV42_21210 [Deltaproteobacteria bacterium]|nr:hypothetical protein [Deltaproteobacteria bacterium]
MSKKIILLLVFLLQILIAGRAVAGWGEAQLIVTMPFGNKLGEMGIDSSDSGEWFTKSFGVSGNGKIVIGDEINKVIHIFNSDGSFFRDIEKPFVENFLWPGKVFVGDNCISEGFIETTHTFNIESGDLIGKAQNMGGIDYIVPDCSKIYVDSENGWIAYTPTGEIVETFPSQPYFLGKYNRPKRQANGNYLTVIEYGDTVFNIRQTEYVEDYLRDNSGRLNVVLVAGEGDTAHQQVLKYDRCSKVAGQLDLPVDTIDQEIVIELAQPGTLEGATLPDMSQYVEYGKPLITSNGDVYAWKRTPETFGVVKWAWTDSPDDPKGGPDMPEEFQALPSTSGIYLTWNPSPQDPGCVTGYDIERATSATGVFSNVTTVPLDEKQAYSFNDTGATAGATWYYRISATSDIGNSDPVEVNATRP